MYIDTPEVRAIVARAFPSYKGNKFQVKPFSGPMRLESYWSGGSRDYYVAVQLTNGQTSTVPENGTPWNPALAECTQLPPNVALVEHCISCGKDLGCTVYVNPENLNRFALPPAIELSLNDKIVLAATVGLKSFARFTEANEVTGITKEQWESTKASLIERKLLNKAGAATDAGRNAISGIRLGSKYGNEPLVTVSY